jgi:transcriptional regulator with XRE-family HTH domain
MYVFAELLRGFRSREGYSQQQLADSIGVPRSTISNWENGIHLPRDLNHVHKIAEILNLFPEDADELLAAADPDKRQPRNDLDWNDDLVDGIRIRSGRIEILREDISSTIQISYDLPDTFASEGLGKAQIKKLAKMFHLLDSRKINQHLRYNDGDISFWYEQGLSLDELIMQFGARKVVLDAADRSGTVIDDQGTLSLVATRVVPLLRRAKGE